MVSEMQRFKYTVRGGWIRNINRGMDMQRVEPNPPPAWSGHAASTQNSQDSKPGHSSYHGYNIQYIYIQYKSNMNAVIQMNHALRVEVIDLLLYK